MTPAQAERLIAAFEAWSKRTPDCRALALAGSWARGQARLDSDLDLIAVMLNPDAYTAAPDWLLACLEHYGFTAATSPSLETYGVARSWRVEAEPAVELELTLVNLDWASTSPVDPGTQRIVSDGIRILADKDGLLAALR